MIDEREKMKSIIQDHLDNANRFTCDLDVVIDALIAAGFGDVGRARADAVAAIEKVRVEHRHATWEAEASMNNGMLVELNYAGEWLEHVEEAVHALAQQKEPSDG